jgi:hypothetical protein
MMVLTLTPAVHTYAAIQILIEARNRRIKSQVEVFPTIAELGKGNSIAIKAAGYALICSLHTKDLWPQLADAPFECVFAIFEETGQLTAAHWNAAINNLRNNEHDQVIKQYTAQHCFSQWYKGTAD